MLNLQLPFRVNRDILTCSITSGAIQHGVPTKVFRTLFLVISPPVARNALTPKSGNTDTQTMHRSEANLDMLEIEHSCRQDFFLKTQKITTVFFLFFFFLFLFYLLMLH